MPASFSLTSSWQGARRSRRSDVESLLPNLRRGWSCFDEISKPKNKSTMFLLMWDFGIRASLKLSNEKFQASLILIPIFGSIFQHMIFEKIQVSSKYQDFFSRNQPVLGKYSSKLQTKIILMSCGVFFIIPSGSLREEMHNKAWEVVASYIKSNLAFCSGRAVDSESTLLPEVSGWIRDTLADIPDALLWFVGGALWQFRSSLHQQNLDPPRHEHVAITGTQRI